LFFQDPDPDLRRRAPAANKSMSIAPAAAATMSKEAPGSGRRKSTGGPQLSADLEKVLVQTPGADRSALKDLPALRDAPPTKREELFVMKLQL